MLESLVLTRQGLPALRTAGGCASRAPGQRDAAPPMGGGANLVALGGYLMREPTRDRDVTLIASGSEVAIAMQAAEMLAVEGIETAVASIPCFELFERQPAAYRREVLNEAPRIAIEAAVRDSWDRFLREDDIFIGMTGFGASAPADALYVHFGITADAIMQTAMALVRADKETG